MRPSFAAYIGYPTTVRRPIHVPRGFWTDPLKIHLMLTEEVGETATELKPLWSDNYGDFDPIRLQEEIADAFVLLSALATRFDIDIETAVTKKFCQKDSLRPWKSAPQ